MDWQPIETAPYDTIVLVDVDDFGTMLARLLPGVSMNANGDACDQWVAETDVYPDCWTEGACWESNHDEVMSRQPLRWMPPPPGEAP